MKMRKGEEEMPTDPTDWMIHSGLAEFLLLHTNEIKYMAMLGYTYLHGCQLFPTLPKDSAFSYKFVSMILKCTGGGILVPILCNGIPVPLAVDAYPIAIMTSCLLHIYLPVLREVLELSPIIKGAVIILYESMRASVVVKLTTLAAAKIAPSEFSIAIFGPIFCGTIGGCGGAFLPFNKGLDPIKMKGLGYPMYTAFIAATFYNIFINTSLSADVVEAPKKAQFLIACFFILYSFYMAFPMTSKKAAPAKAPAPVKKETKKTK